jgi:hypothetical protein
MTTPSVKQARTTARYYGFEKVLETMPGFASLMRKRSIGDLQLFAGYVWAREGGRGECPLIRSKQVQDEAKSWSEYTWGSRTIHLLRKHHDLYSLLHELAHALGNRDKLTHGPAFRRRCIRLYKTYGDWNGVVDWEKETA